MARRPSPRPRGPRLVEVASPAVAAPDIGAGEVGGWGDRPVGRWGEWLGERGRGRERGREAAVRKNWSEKTNLDVLIYTFH